MNSLASTNVQKQENRIVSAPSLHVPGSTPHPFTSLPVEIVTEIFFQCLPHDDEECTPSPSVAPLLLCRVSSLWRNAARADPRLWRHLTLNPKHLVKLPSLEPLTRATTRMVEQSIMWLKNSKDLGLDLDVTVPISFWDADFYSSESQLPSPMEVADRWDGFIMPVLVDRGGRLRTLRLDFGAASLLQSFFFEAEDQPHPAMTRLESLTIKGEHLQVADTGDSARLGRGCTLKRFTSASRLKRVAILVKNRIPFPLQLPRDFLPWAQLTHLMITMACSGSFWKYVLAQCVCLEEGYINIEHCIALPEVDCDPPLPECGYIELPRLNTLDVTFHDEYTSAYFEDFRFPQLHKLLVACDFGSGFPTFTWLPPTQSVNFFLQLKNLTSLTLSYQNMTEVEILGLLKHTVLLEDLVLDSYLVDHKTFLRALIVKPDPTAPTSGTSSCSGVSGGTVEGSSSGKMHVDGETAEGNEQQPPLLPKLKTFRFFLEYFADVPPTSFDEEDFLAVMTSRSEVAREVANNLTDEDALSTSKMPVAEEDESMVEDDDDESNSDSNEELESDSADDELDVEMSGSGADLGDDGKDDHMHTAGMTVPPPTPANTVPPTPITPSNRAAPSFDTLLGCGKPPSAAPRRQLPPISKLLLPICHVELSTDAREPCKFRRLESFEAGVERYNREENLKKKRPTVMTSGRTTDFAFKLEFSTPSNWALQDSEPVWF